MSIRATLVCVQAGQVVRVDMAQEGGQGRVVDDPMEKVDSDSGEFPYDAVEGGHFGRFKGGLGPRRSVTVESPLQSGGEIKKIGTRKGEKVPR